MEIREARPEDNEELQRLQAKCPQGTNLRIAVVNTPDFFARAKAYRDYRVYVALEDKRIVGSAACALRKALVNRKEEKVGYVFQAFVDPDYRGKHIASKMYKIQEEYLRQNGAVLVYSIVMEGNLPSMRHLTREGFGLYRTLTLQGLAVFKNLTLSTNHKIRPATIEDLPTVAELKNETWKNFELYEPVTTEELRRFVDQTPGYKPGNLYVLETEGRISACLGFWDWSRIIRMKVEQLNPKMQVFNHLLNVARIFRPMPSLPRQGELIKPIILTPVAFKKIQFLTPLLRHINNIALQMNIGYVYLISERNDPVLTCMRGFTRSETGIHLYIKYLEGHVKLNSGPLFLDSIDA
jgi:ribosomal protein S18 acetylase RimI-like enzyme